MVYVVCLSKKGSTRIRGVEDDQSLEHFNHTPYIRREHLRLLNVGCPGNRSRFEPCLPHESA